MVDDFTNSPQVPQSNTGSVSTGEPGASAAVDEVWKTPPELASGVTSVPGVLAQAPIPGSDNTLLPKPANTGPSASPSFMSPNPHQPAILSGKKSVVGKIVAGLAVLLVIIVVVAVGLVYADDKGIVTTNIAVLLRFTHISSFTGGLSSDPKQAGLQVTNALQGKHSFTLTGQLRGYSNGSATLSCSASNTVISTPDKVPCSTSTTIDPLSLDTAFNLVAIGQNFVLKNTISDAGVNIQTEYRSVDGLLYQLSTFGSSSTTPTPQTDGQWIKSGPAPAISPDTIRDRIGSLITVGTFKGADVSNNVPRYHFSSSITGNDLPILSAFAGNATIDPWLQSNGSIDIWVARKDHLPTRMLIHVTDASGKKIQLDATFTTTTLGEVSAPSGATDPTAVLSPDQMRKADVASLASALAKYLAEKGSYPVSSMVDRLDKADSVLAKALVPVYMNALPKDSNPKRYYGYVSDGTTYELSAALDDGNDPDVHSSGPVHLYIVKNPAVVK